jgi:large subunit ribosomal protein L25
VGSSIDLEPETLIVNVTNAPTAEAMEAELAEAEAEAGMEPTVAATAEPAPDEAPAESETD